MIEVNLTYLSELSFPVYMIGKEKPMNIDNVLCYIRLYHATEDREEECSIKILDDKKIPGNTLAKRRLVIKDQGETLHRLSKAIFFLGDLVKFAKFGVWFIDSNGKLFQYSKINKAKLKYHEIEQVIPINTGGAIIALKDLMTRFKVLHCPDSTVKYAGILHFNMSKILYGLYDKKYDESWRRV